MASHLHEQFLTLWERFGAPVLTPVSEYRFTFEREWRLDCAFPDSLVGVEIDGGTWTRGRHSRGAGYAEDCRKINHAATLGWAVLRYTSDMLMLDPLGVVQEVETMLDSRRANRTRSRLIGAVLNLKPGDAQPIGTQTIARVNARKFELRDGGKVIPFATGKGRTLDDVRKSIVQALEAV